MSLFQRVCARGRERYCFFCFCNVFNFYKAFLEGAFSLETVAIKRPRADLFFLRNSVFFKFVYIFFSKSALKRSVWRAFWSQGPPKSAPSSFQLIKGLFGRCVFPADRCKKEASGRLLFFLKFVCFRIFYIISKQCFGGHVLGPKDRPKNAPRTPKVSPKMAHQAPRCECANVGPHTNG